MTNVFDSLPARTKTDPNTHVDINQLQGSINALANTSGTVAPPGPAVFEDRGANGAIYATAIYATMSSTPHVVDFSQGNVHIITADTTGSLTLSGAPGGLSGLIKLRHNGPFSVSIAGSVYDGTFTSSATSTQYDMINAFFDSKNSEGTFTVQKGFAQS